MLLSYHPEMDDLTVGVKMLRNMFALFCIQTTEEMAKGVALGKVVVY